jgi:hypothetical protein
MRKIVAEMFPQPPKLEEELSQLLKRLGALDRYERAALARRNKSIRTTIAQRARRQLICWPRPDLSGGFRALTS